MNDVTPSRQPGSPGGRRRAFHPVGRRPHRERDGAAASVALGVLVLLATVAFNGWLLTSHDTGVRYLRHVLARVTEIDRLVVAGQEEMRVRAQASPDGAVRLPGYPIGVDLPSAFVAQADRPALRSAVLRASAQRVYDEGADAFLDEDARTAAAGPLTATGAIRRALSIVGDRTHAAFTVLAATLAAASCLAAAVVWRRKREASAALTAVGTAVAAGAAMAALTALLAGGLAHLLKQVEGEYLATQLLSVFADTTMLVLRTSALIAVAGVAIALGGRRLRRPRGQRDLQ